MMREVIALSVLPAVWRGLELRGLAESVVDVVWTTLDLELVYVRMDLPSETGVIEIVRGSDNPVARELRGTIARLLDANDDSQLANPIEIDGLRVVYWSIQLRGGRMFMAVTRNDEAFPTPGERLILNVIANHAKVAIQHGAAVPSSKARTELEHGRAPGRGLAHWQVRRVTAFMREHLDREISLDELAALLDLSRYHFCTAFRQATGKTPHEWFVLERMRRARELLADPSLSITQVAFAVGYKTPSAFSAAFRRTTGNTPSELRRNLDVVVAKLR